MSPEKKTITQETKITIEVDNSKDSNNNDLAARLEKYLNASVFYETTSSIDVETFIKDPDYRDSIVRSAKDERSYKETFNLPYNHEMYEQFMKDVEALEKVEKPKEEGVWTDFENILKEMKQKEAEVEMQAKDINERERGIKEEYKSLETRKRELAEAYTVLEETGTKSKAEMEKILEARAELDGDIKKFGEKEKRYQTDRRKLSKERKTLESKLSSIKEMRKDIARYTPKDETTIYLFLRILSRYKDMSNLVSKVVDAGYKKIRSVENKLKTAKSWGEFFKNAGLNKMHEIWNESEYSGVLTSDYSEIMKGLLELESFQIEKPIEELYHDNKLEITNLAMKFPYPQKTIDMATNEDFSKIAVLASISLEETKRESAAIGEKKFMKRYGMSTQEAVETTEQIKEIAKKTEQYEGAILPKDAFNMVLQGKYWKQKTYREKNEDLFSTRLLEQVTEALIENDILAEDSKNLEELKSKTNYYAAISYIPESLYPLSIPKEGSSIFEAYEKKIVKTPTAEIEKPISLIDLPLKNDSDVHYFAIFDNLKEYNKTQQLLATAT